MGNAGLCVPQYTRESWFEEHAIITWEQLPTDATHFNFSGLDMLKIENDHIYKWESQIKIWFDISKYYNVDQSVLIKKDT